MARLRPKDRADLEPDLISRNSRIFVHIVLGDFAFDANQVPRDVLDRRD